MGGIGGLYNLEAPAEERIVSQMLHAMAHRGSDGCGMWRRGPIALCHAMRFTTPESVGERLPYLCESTGLAITADARLDNREELAAELGTEAASHPDSLLILRAYHRWDDECVSRLVGDYAFAIWDSRKQSIFCARDHFGLKPFYYAYRDGRCFAFASEPKGLFGLSWLSRRINEERVADYLALLAEDKEYTFYTDIKRLPGAHTLTLDASGTVKLKRYWRAEAGHELRLGSEVEYAAAFRHAFTTAVRRRLRSAFPIGSTLSGGLDSSSITCVARDLLGEHVEPLHLHTFSAVFPSLPEPVRSRIDERSYMKAVVETGGIQPCWIEADRLSPLCEIDRVVHHNDEPVMAPNLYLHWAMFAAARERDVRIFLDGTDGDSTVGDGLESLPEMARSFRWRRMVREIRALAHRSGSTVPLAKLIWLLAVRPLTPGAAARLYRGIRGRKRVSRMMAIRRDFAARTGVDERLKQSFDESQAGSARQKQAAFLDSAVVQYGMEICDKSAAAFGVEVRYPFFDKDLVELCLRVPSRQKLSGGWTRMIFRRAMTGVLPAEVQWRAGKSDLSPGFTYGLARSERDLLASTVLESRGRLGEYVDLAAARAMYERYMSDPVKFPSEAVALYSFANLSRWLDSL